MECQECEKFPACVNTGDTVNKLFETPKAPKEDNKCSSLSYSGEQSKVCCRNGVGNIAMRQTCEVQKKFAGRQLWGDQEHLTQQHTAERIDKLEGRQMEIFETVEDLLIARQIRGKQDIEIVFVPLLGGLHEGHLQLLRTARALCYKLSKPPSGYRQKSCCCSTVPRFTAISSFTDYNCYPATCTCMTASCRTSMSCCSLASMGSAAYSCSSTTCCSSIRCSSSTSCCYNRCCRPSPYSYLGSCHSLRCCSTASCCSSYGCSCCPSYLYPGHFDWSFPTQYYRGASSNHHTCNLCCRSSPCHRCSFHCGSTIWPVKEDEVCVRCRSVPLKRARRSLEVWCSLYPNELPFEAIEEWETYPTNGEPELSLLRRSGLVDVVFKPNEKNGGVYFFDDPKKDALFPVMRFAAEDTFESEGRLRKGFFRDFATILVKFFTWIRPSFAIFDQKDFLQSVLARRLADQYFRDIIVIVHPTVRDSLGNAYSTCLSRLSDHHYRFCAPLVFHLLLYLTNSITKESFGACDIRRLLRSASRFAAAQRIQLSYIAVHNWHSGRQIFSVRSLDTHASTMQLEPFCPVPVDKDHSEEDIIENTVKKKDNIATEREYERKSKSDSEVKEEETPLYLDPKVKYCICVSASITKTCTIADNIVLEPTESSKNWHHCTCRQNVCCCAAFVSRHLCLLSGLIYDSIGLQLRLINKQDLKQLFQKEQQSFPQNEIISEEAIVSAHRVAQPFYVGVFRTNSDFGNNAINMQLKQMSNCNGISIHSMEDELIGYVIGNLVSGFGVPEKETYWNHYPGGETLLIKSFVIDKRYRCRGYGKQLLHDYCTYVSGLIPHRYAIKRIAVITHFHLINFYEKLHFRLIRKWPGIFGHQTWYEMIMYL